MNDFKNYGQQIVDAMNKLTGASMDIESNQTVSRIINDIVAEQMEKIYWRGYEDGRSCRDNQKLH